METAPLKSFATWARTSLIREVAARIAVVLAPAAPERVELYKAVEALEKAVNASGGGDKGKAAVADRVAYTWFNRIIALRFMDANGYTGVGIVSPQAGAETGQPEILAEAKRGNFEAAVVGAKTRETVTGLLNGTRRSVDAQGEAYALLLADYCRHWNRAMPFMFEPEGDFTELLIPGNLLADDSVPSRAVRVLTRGVCRDVEVIGWLYQFYISERKDEVFAGFRRNKKAGAGEIPAATQLFTPHWIVRYLVENSLGRLWMLNHPTSQLVDQMEYYIAPVDEETDFLMISRPEELKVVDPACGSGHMLTYAFDLLYSIYEEEGYAPAEIPGLILTNNLYGVEIDPRAGALAAFALTMKARSTQRTFFSKQIEPSVCVLDPIHFKPDEIDYLLTRGGDKHAETAFWNQFEHADTLGSLIQPDLELLTILRQHLAQLDEGGDLLLADILNRASRVVLQSDYLRRGYGVVVANPPYMGSSNMDARLTAYAQREHPESRSDLFAMFIERCWGLAVERGLVGMIAMQSWMFLPSFARLRERYGAASQMISLVHLGAGAFDTIGGEVVATVAWVWSRIARPERPAPFIDLTAVNGEAGMGAAFRGAVTASEPATRVHIHSLSDFLSVPGGVFAYQLGEEEFAAFGACARLGDVLELREGINTGENARFLRRWWEVEYRRTSIALPRPSGAEQKWVPYKKGGPYRKWAGNEEYVVDWSNNGAEIKASPRARPQNTQYFFRESVSWSRIAGSNFSLRSYGPGFGFDSTGPSAFGSAGDLRFALAFLNSHLAGAFLRALSPTLDFRLGNMSNLPIPFNRDEVDLSQVDELIELTREDWNEQEFSWSFCRTPLLTAGAARVSIAWERVRDLWATRTDRVAALESINNQRMAMAYSLHHSAQAAHANRVSLFCNPHFRYGAKLARDAGDRQLLRDALGDFVSYAVGCMFGRFSLDEPGLVLADQGATVRDYLARVPKPTFPPDRDNVIPIVDGDWFEDDIVARFREFLRAAFGEQHFEENLRFVTESLGVKDIRDYFVRAFYKEHVQRYSQRPIYWLFSSPKGSFNALVYMHRYTPSTVSTVLNEYLREFTAKLTSSLHQQERLAAGSGTPRQQGAAQREADRLRRVLLELEEYEHEVLYPLASRQLAIDLDDGVKANYPKFGAALKKIPGLEAGDE